MKASAIELLKNDEELRVIQSLPIPAISVRGRSLIYNNLKGDLFLNNGRSCFSKYRQGFGEIKTMKGTCEVVCVPTAHGKRFAITYGRENDIIFLFPEYAYDLMECVEYNRDLTYDILAYVVKVLLNSSVDLKDLCVLVLERMNVFEENVTLSNLIALVKQIVLRISRNEIIDIDYNFSEGYIKKEEAYYIISELVYVLASCNLQSVCCSVYSDNLCISVDGIDLIKAKINEKEIFVTHPFISTVKDLIVSSIVAFITELYFYE